MVDLRRCPKTARFLEERGVVLVEGKPKLASSWHMACAPHLRGAKKEHKERQEAVRSCSTQPDSVAFLGWVLLMDSWRHVRAEAVRALTEHKTEQSQLWITLALADRSQLVVRAAHKALPLQGAEALVPFRVLFALWEDQVGNSTYLMQCALGMAKRNPQPAMRQVLPRLEQEARKFFILPQRRRALRELIAELDKATAHLKDLPLTAMASVEAESLPLPASGSEQAAVPHQTQLPWWRRLLRFGREHP
jgi:hypothetical protein